MTTTSHNGHNFSGDQDTCTRSTSCAMTWGEYTSIRRNSRDMPPCPYSDKPEGVYPEIFALLPDGQGIDFEAVREELDALTDVGVRTGALMGTGEPDLGQRLSLAMRLLAMTETETAAELPVLRKRISDALEYMDDVASPNTHSLAHIRRFLTGAYEN